MLKCSGFFIIFIFIAFFFPACKTTPETAEEPVVEIIVPETGEIEEIVKEIEILEPEFNIISIYILQADLVVTEFEAVLMIVNPNEFAIELSSINYQLYGNGEYWADGVANNILRIPALSTGETSFIFKMNFIDNTRRLLNEVMAMRRINYQFRGTAQIHPVINNASVFNVVFSCSGLSEVIQRPQRR